MNGNIGVVCGMLGPAMYDNACTCHQHAHPPISSYGAALVRTVMLCSGPSWDSGGWVDMHVPFAAFMLTHVFAFAGARVGAHGSMNLRGGRDVL